MIVHENPDIVCRNGEAVTFESAPEEAKKLLVAVWGADEDGALDGAHFIASPTHDGGWQHFPVTTISDAVGKALTLARDGRNAYFACAEYMTPHAGRKGENAKGTRAFWLDIDCGPTKAAEGKGYVTKREAVEALSAFCKAAGLPAPNVIVDSGNGLHVYWVLDAFVPSERWRELARVFKALAAKHGFKADSSRTADIASVLRVAGTANFKDPANPKPVRIKHQVAPVSFEAFKAALERSIEPAPGGQSMTAALTAEAGYAPMPETPENIERVKAMLAVIPADCDRDTWRNICWSVLATGWACAEKLAREWSMTAPQKFEEEDIQKVIDSFERSRPGGSIGFGTLVYTAQQYGYVEPGTIAGVRFTGKGGDVKNGEIFAKAYRNKLLFIHETNDVMRFNPVQGWVTAPPGEGERAAKALWAKMHEIAVEHYKRAPDDPKTKRLMAHVERTSKAANIWAMIEMAKSEQGMTVRLSDFDTDPMLLGVANGVLDLHTVQLLPMSPNVLVSKRCNVAYTPDAECPRFRKFLEEIQPDPDMRAFLQRAAGYFLTGSVKEQKFLFFYGTGANGKSVLVELLAWLLGDYARKIATEMLMHHQRSPQGPSPDIVALKGRRFVYANETEEGRRLAEARVKDMTGGDTLTGRVPYSKADITFEPTHKLVIVGNHKPEITDGSFGMWRRVALVPFDVTIPEKQRDANLLETLKTEGSGILNWMLEGLRMWRKDGLAVPNKIEAATAAYRDEQDILGDWINDHCDTGAGCTEQKTKLYKAYRAWALSNGHHPLSQSRLTRRLNERGYLLQRDKRTVGGLKLNTSGLAAAAYDRVWGC